MNIRRCYFGYLEPLVSNYKAARSSNPTGGYGDEGIRRFDGYHEDGNKDGSMAAKEKGIVKHFGILPSREEEGQIKYDATAQPSSLSCFDKPLSFNLDEFSSIIGLKYCENYAPSPPKETVRARLATLRLVDEKDTSISSTDLVNSSPLRTRYFSPTWRVLMVYIVKCLGGMQGSHDQLNINHQMIAYSLCWGLDIDIGNILFSDLVVKLTTGKKGREPNICYTRYLSLIMEHLLRNAYKNDKLKTSKPHEISATSFKKPSASEVPLTSHMLKVAKLSPMPEESLILPSGGVNAGDTVDKSLFGTSVQPVNQPKAPTDKKSKKKKNPASSKPKTSKIVRESSPIKQVIDTQHAEEPVATNTTKGIESFESAEELRNHTKLVDAERVRISTSISKYFVHYESAPWNDTLRFITLDVDPENSRLCKDPQHLAHESQTSECLTFTQPQGSLNHNKKSPNVHETIVENVVKNPKITSLGNVSFEELYGHAEESPFDIESEIKFTGKDTLVDSLFLDEKMKEADFDLESMSDNEIMSMSENDEDIDDSEELSKNDEIDADKVIDDLVNMANTKDATLNVFAALSLPISIVSASLSSLGNIQTLIAKLPDLLYTTLKDILPQMLKDSVKQALPKFDKRVKKTLKAGVDELVLKPLNKDCNTLNTMKRRRFFILQKQQSKAIKKTMDKSVQRSVTKQTGAVPTDIMVINAKQLQTKVEKNVADIHELVKLTREVVCLMDLVPASVRADNKGEKESQAQPTLAEEVPTPAQEEHKTSDDPETKKLKVVMEDIPIPSPTLLNSIRPPVIINNIPFEQFSANLFSSSSSEFSPILPPNMTDKGKRKALVSDDDQMKQAMPLIEEGGSAPSLSNLHQFRTTGEGPLTIEEAKLHIQEIKRLADLKAEKEKSEKRIKRVLSPDELRA
ncbi:hypothetical protein Tco_1361555 [Tanacetum coccineum]